MNKQLFKFFLLLICINIIIACKIKPKDAEAAFRAKYLIFGADSTYSIKLGSTIAFGYSETQGIDRGRFPSPSYGRNLDTAFFKYVGEESFYPEGCAGCAASYYTVYKAIKKGTTNIEEYKTTYLQDTQQLPAPKDTTIVYGKYIVYIK